MWVEPALSSDWAAITTLLSAARLPLAGLDDRAEWFQRLGFEPVARDTVPAELLASPEFVDACPASAACLLVRLGRPEISLP
jgi:hypothetical protein